MCGLGCCAQCLCSAGGRDEKALAPARGTDQPQAKQCDMAAIIVIKPLLVTYEMPTSYRSD